MSAAAFSGCRQTDVAIAGVEPRADCGTHRSPAVSVVPPSCDLRDFGEDRRVVATLARVMGLAGWTDPLAHVAVKEHALALVAPTPLRLLSCAAVAEHCGVMAALARIMGVPVGR